VIRASEEYSVFVMDVMGVKAGSSMFLKCLAEYRTVEMIV
jgi:hypothetical protein